MTVEALEGRQFAARPFRVCTEKVAEFVAVTGDDRQRWDTTAPPGFAAALLFVVAPELLNDPLVADSAVIHGDQSFEWHQDIGIESDLEVTGTVRRVRSRGETAFVSFDLAAVSAGIPIVSGSSTFLLVPMSSPIDPTEPVGVFDRAPTMPPGSSLPSPRSASRADLVRYAAATRDWNPIHWDHNTAVDAGLGGVVVHGLLQSAWLTQVVAATGPLASARFRYRSPMRPSEAGEIDGEMSAESADLKLAVGDRVIVSGSFSFRS